MRGSGGLEPRRQLGELGADLVDRPLELEPLGGVGHPRLFGQVEVQLLLPGGAGVVVHLLPLRSDQQTSDLASPMQVCSILTLAC
ncbi:hypothetical protein CKO31_25940, partial [Thiohalocapsa halophila]